jgi:two-component system cell cycle sensor histidine kinase/response regulator CckA
VATALQEDRVVALGNDLLLVARDGTERPVADSAAPIKDDQGQVTGAVLVFHDMTEHRYLEERLRAAQKLEAIGKLAGGIAHDFNNLMTVVLGSSDLLLNDARQPAEARALLEGSTNAAERAAALTRQLLAFSRKQILVPVVLDLNRLITDLAQMLRRLIGEHIDLVVVPHPALPPVKADPGQLQQVLLNLVVNARDAMPRGAGRP